ncbi:hypothetical protein CGRA01v4_07196 [Colletotrichum graminicola]|nr:hypothetical protein CGRA01v4_07196 [Colletotrichum graminicola]
MALQVVARTGHSKSDFNWAIAVFCWCQSLDQNALTTEGLKKRRKKERKKERKKKRRVQGEAAKMGGLAEDNLVAAVSYHSTHSQPIQSRLGQN